MNRHEVWLPVKDYIDYEVSNYGRVRSLKFGKIKMLKGRKRKKGYLHVILCNDEKKSGFYIHRLVYETFVGEIPEGMQIDHRDGNTQNNRLDNLRCVTPKENVYNPVTRPKHIDAIRNALNKPVLQIDKETGEIIKEWWCISDVERELGIKKQNVSNCCRGIYGFKSAGGFKWRYA